MSVDSKTSFRLNGIIGMRRYPLIYLNMPKCACTTIKNIMQFIDCGSYIDDPLTVHRKINRGEILVSYKNMDELLNSIKNKRMAFTFVRNPLNRAYSCFIEKIYYISPYSFPRIGRHIIQNYGMAPIVGHTDNGISAEVMNDSFKKFLLFVRDNIVGKTSIRKDAHWALQKSIIDRFSRVVSIDLIGRVEHYKRDMSYVLECIGIENPILLSTRFNEGPPPPYSLDEIMSDDIKALAEEVYEQDYLAFGY